jgi:hypothetical protein
MAAGAIQTRSAVGEDPLRDLAAVGRDVGRTLTRATYTGFYFVAYAAVFTGVFVGRAIPQKNPVIKGLRDGGRAAREVIDEDKARPARR